MRAVRAGAASWPRRCMRQCCEPPVVALAATGVPSLPPTPTPSRKQRPSPPPPSTPLPLITPCTSNLARSTKEALLGGQRGCVVWFTGLSGAGKSAVAMAVDAGLADRRVATAFMDGDMLRAGLCAGLGFSAEDRAENVRRVGEAALLAAEAGLVALAALISPYAAGRASVRGRCSAMRVPFIEVYVATPLHVCEARDVKGLYAMSKAGRLQGLTGTCAAAPYEAPLSPDLHLAGVGELGEAAAAVIAHLEGEGLIPVAPPPSSNNAVPFSAGPCRRMGEAGMMCQCDGGEG